MNIKCNQCDGHYKIRDGKFGVFAGCSNFPNCKSTMKVFEIVQTFIQEHGINIYRWEKECWKCRKPTFVYSYYLDYELKEIDEYLSSYGTIGLGDLSCIDRLISNEIPSIKMCYSNTTKSKYMANTCIHCGALQGRNYVVDDPHEIIDELWHNRNMVKFLYKTIYLENIIPLISDLKRIYSGGE
jgi:hypothetical protein